MAGELKLNNVSVATESGGTVTVAPNNVTFAANHAGIKTALNASGSAPVYACRAWANFNGTGTVALRSSGNVSSLTDNGSGDYTITFATAMPDANYCVTGITNGNSLAERAFNYICLDYKNNGTGTQPSTASIRINTGANSSQQFAAVIQDSSDIMVSIFR